MVLDVYNNLGFKWNVHIEHLKEILMASAPYSIKKLNETFYNKSRKCNLLLCGDRGHTCMDVCRQTLPNLYILILLQHVYEHTNKLIRNDYNMRNNSDTETVAYTPADNYGRLNFYRNSIIQSLAIEQRNRLYTVAEVNRSFCLFNTCVP